MPRTTSLRVVLSVLLSSMGALVSSSVPTYNPIPPKAAGPPIPTDVGYRLQPFGHGAYMVTEGVYQALFLVTTDSVVVVDAPSTIGENMLKAIESVTSKPVSHLVYSHSHADHIGGAYLLTTGGNVSIVAHELTAQTLALSPDYEHRPAPTITFRDTYTLHVCNQTLELSYSGPNHEPGNIFIYAPTQKVLMLVDVVFPGWTPFDRLGEVQSVPGVMKAHDQILAYDFDHYIGGHLNRAGTRKDVLTQKEYVQDLYDACVEAILLSAQPGNSSNPLSAATLLPPVVKANPGNPWADFRVYLDALTAYAANVTTAKWADRLAGFDVWAVANADVMLESVRIDFGVLGPFGVHT